MEILDLSFYQKYSTIELAKALLGKQLVHETDEGLCSGTIVETEAYLENDPACHAFNKRTARNEVMYEPAGYAYVYLIYGMYNCFNVVSGVKDRGEAVLIRALEPLEGIDLMHKRRTKAKQLMNRDLCSGPGKLVQSLAIQKSQNGHELWSLPLYLKVGDLKQPKIVTTTRIGIAPGKGDDLPYRFYIENNSFISRK